jgi:hypothetical protein
MSCVFKLSLLGNINLNSERTASSETLVTTYQMYGVHERRLQVELPLFTYTN